MTEVNTPSKFAVEVIGFRIPGNWDRPIGYEGHRRFVVVYWDHAVDDVFITDGFDGRSGGAWWLYTNLIENDARQNIAAAMMASGCPTLANRPAFGAPGIEATHGLILDRFEHSLWVAQLADALSFLQRQYHKIGSDNVTASVLANQRKEIFDSEAIHSFLPCHCDRGWILSSNCYVPCPECRRSGRIVTVSQQVIL